MPSDRLDDGGPTVESHVELPQRGLDLFGIRWPTLINSGLVLGLLVGAPLSPRHGCAATPEVGSSSSAHTGEVVRAALDVSPTWVRCSWRADDGVERVAQRADKCRRWPAVLFEDGKAVGDVDDGAFGARQPAAAERVPVDLHAVLTWAVADGGEPIEVSTEHQGAQQFDRLRRVVGMQMRLTSHSRYSPALSSLEAMYRWLTWLWAALRCASAGSGLSR